MIYIIMIIYQVIIHIGSVCVPTFNSTGYTFQQLYWMLNIISALLFDKYAFHFPFKAKIFTLLAAHLSCDSGCIFLDYTHFDIPSLVARVKSICDVHSMSTSNGYLISMPFDCQLKQHPPSRIIWSSDILPEQKKLISYNLHNTSFWH